MKRLVLWSLLGIGLLGMSACGEDELTPQIDTTPEYEKVLQLDENSIHADTLIYEWYKKYNTAVLYTYREADFRWQWASQYTRYFTMFDPSEKADSAAIETLVQCIKESVMDVYSEKLIADNLPYRIFLAKELHTGSSTTSKFQIAELNNQDAMMVGYLKSANGTAYSAKDIKNQVGTLFTQLFFDKIEVKPEAFFASVIPCKLNMITWPITATGEDDEAIEAEQSIYPDFVDSGDVTARQTHCANVIGYIKAGSKGPVYAPTQAEDYAAFYGFIISNPGSYIRQLTQYYWRLAKRASLFIEYYKDVNNEDLIEMQNKQFPNDKVTIEDFSYSEK